jgi:hypothetical protein
MLKVAKLLLPIIRVKEVQKTQGLVYFAKAIIPMHLFQLSVAQIELAK